MDLIFLLRCDWEAPMRRLLAMARVKEWDQFQWPWIPGDLLLGNLGQCRVTAGMRGSRTILDQDGLWFHVSDGAHQFVSVRLDRGWVKSSVGG